MSQRNHSDFNHNARLIPGSKFKLLFHRRGGGRVKQGFAISFIHPGKSININNYPKRSYVKGTSFQTLGSEGLPWDAQSTNVRILAVIFSRLNGWHQTNHHHLFSLNFCVPCEKPFPHVSSLKHRESRNEFLI